MRTIHAILLTATIFAFVFAFVSETNAWQQQDVGDTEQIVLDYISDQIATHAHLKNKIKEDQKTDPEAAISADAEGKYYDSLMRAADVAEFLNLHQADAWACNVLAVVNTRRYIRHLRDKLAITTEQVSNDPSAARKAEALGAQALKAKRRAKTLFLRSLFAARRAGDIPREMTVTRGLMAFERDLNDADANTRLLNLLRAYADLATVSGRVSESLPVILKEAKNAKSVQMTFTANLLRPTMTTSMDAVAKARFTGDNESMSRLIRKLIDRRGLVLTGGKLAEEIGDIHGLQAVFDWHNARNDFVAEARVGRQLVGLLPDGEKKMQVRKRTFAAALAANDLITAAEMAPNETVAASLRDGAREPEVTIANSVVELDSVDSTVPDWLRDGRSPPEGDAFTEKVIAMLLGPEIKDPTDGFKDGYVKSEMIDFAELDGSHAFVAPLFEFIYRDAYKSRAADAAYVIAQLATLEDLPKIRKALEHESWQVRRFMAVLLSRLVKQDASLTELLESSLAAEQDLAVQAALRWGLLNTARANGHLSELQKIVNKSKEPPYDMKSLCAASTAAVVLFDNGYDGSAALVLDNVSRRMPGDTGIDAARMLAFTSRPEAFEFIENQTKNNDSLVQDAAKRAMHYLDTPAARSWRRRQRQEPQHGSDIVWLGVRDGRRGMIDPETIVKLVKKRNADYIKPINSYARDLTNWVIGESLGKVKYRIPVNEGRVDRDKEQRLVLRGLEERKPYPRPRQQGSDMVFSATNNPRSNDDGARKNDRKNKKSKANDSKRIVKLIHEEKMAVGLVVINLAPVATLIDESNLTINLNRTQRHSGGHMDQLQGPLWINFELKMGAEDALVQARIEGLSAEPLVADNAKFPTFDLPKDVTTEQVRAAKLVLEFKFFQQKKTEQFPLQPILLLGSEIKPDLVVEKLSLKPSAPRPGVPVNVLFDIVNIGHAKSGPTQASVYANNKLKPNGRTRIGRVSIPGIDQGQRVEAALAASVSSDTYLSNYTPGWLPDDQDTSIEVVIDEDEEVEELNEDNNSIERPVTLVLNDEERSVRRIESALEKLATLNEQVDALKPDAEPNALRKALADTLEELEAIRPRTPGLDQGRKLIRMLGAQAESRSRIKGAIDDIAKFVPKAGVNEADEEANAVEASRLLGELLRAQADLVRSGVPVSAKQISEMNENVAEFTNQFGEDVPLFDAEQKKALDDAVKSVRIRDGVNEILGDRATGAPESDFGALVFPALDPQRRAVGEEFLRQNIESNRNGIDVANAAFRRGMERPGEWFSVRDLEAIQAEWHNWTMPSTATNEWVDGIHQSVDKSPVTLQAEDASQRLMKRFGL